MSDIQRSFGLRFLKYVGLHPKSNRTFSRVLAPFQITSAGFCLVISYHQLFFGKKDVASLVKNVEACAAMIQAS